MQKFVIHVLTLCLLAASPSFLYAQDPVAPAPATTTSDPQVQSEHEIQKQEQSQRVLGIMPQFSVTDRQDAAALTTKQKFGLFVRSAVDPFNFVVLGMQAGISQATNSFPEYGQGAAGFGKRYGAALADATSSGLFSNFVYPTLFQADPRYFRLGKGSFKRRFGYSLAQQFVCHRDRGGKTFHFSNVLGAFTAGGISNAYYPPADRGFGLTMSRAGIALIYGSLGGVLNEFWPDIDKKIFKHDKQ